MSRRTRRRAVTLVAAVLAHELLLWGLADADPVSALFSPSAVTPVTAVLVAVVLLGLRLALYFVLPYLLLFGVLQDLIQSRRARLGPPAACARPVERAS